jgi:nucleoside-diphosphate-sugar epimerase
MQLASYEFSTITLRQGTVCGYSPRMRLDLVVNTMYKTSISEKKITVNNPSIWRPILAIQDAAQAYIKAIQAEHDISGIFNVTSGNFTVGEIAENVKSEIKKEMGLDIEVITKNIHDKRNYKVSCRRAKENIGFDPKHSIQSIIDELNNNFEKFKDFDNPNYYNIQIFKKMN